MNEAFATTAITGIILLTAYVSYRFGRKDGKAMAWEDMDPYLSYGYRAIRRETKKRS